MCTKLLVSATNSIMFEGGVVHILRPCHTHPSFHPTSSKQLVSYLMHLATYIGSSNISKLMLNEAGSR